METFVNAAIKQADKELPFLARALAELPDCQGEELSEVQRAFRSGDYEGAFSTLKEYLHRHSLPAKPKFNGDPTKFTIFRKACGSQNKAATALGISQSAICQFERKGEGLGFGTMLRAADYFGVAPREIIIAEQHMAGADIIRIDRKKA